MPEELPGRSPSAPRAIAIIGGDYKKERESGKKSFQGSGRGLVSIYRASYCQNRCMKPPIEPMLAELKLELDGEDLGDRPLIERRKFLESIDIERVPQTDDVTAAHGWFDELGRGIEGIVAKKKTQPYRSGERGWIKVEGVPNHRSGGGRADTGVRAVARGLRRRWAFPSRRDDVATQAAVAGENHSDARWALY